METLPVTLIVKAPNQQIEDQTVKCELSWTIQKLKQHLSEVYPSKPPKHEQKLIYSGQLLNDSVMLKDILRQYEGQETHTVHLVCATKYSKVITPQPQQVSQTPPATAPANETTTNNANTTDAQPAQTPLPNPEGQNAPNVPWMNMNTNGPTMAPMDANQYAVQLAWMQHAYYQYVTQYMQLAANSYGSTPLLGTVPNNGEPAHPPDQIPPNRGPAPDAPIAAARDPDHPERDWLDVFYMLSRALVLFSVIYFYSSPIRFIFVLLLGFGLYLYQIGFFRNINNINNNNNNVPPDPVPEEERVPSRLTVVWTFFATFFASLIPEIPNAV